MENSIGLLLSIQVILIVLNAIFASAEIAVISMNDSKLEKLARSGDRRALRLVKLTSQPARFLATIQVAITLSGFLGSAFAADNFSDIIVDWLISLEVTIPRATLDAISVVVITLILSYFTLIFGELVPKRVAMRKADSLALGLSSLINGISIAFAPIVWFLTSSTNIVLRLLGIDPNEEDEEVGEEEIRMMVDVSSEKGKIDPEEKQFIQNVFEFDDLIADEIATHRTDIDLLYLHDSLEEWDKVIRNGIHTFYPVCDGTVDKVIGVLNAKVYFRLNHYDRKVILEEAIKPPYFVPENAKADILFKNMKQTHNTFAIVLDEYGGVSGIITMNDLIEKLVGVFEIEEQESTNKKIETVECEGKLTWHISGNASIEDVEKALEISLSDNDCDTFGGYVFSILGEVPKDGTKLDLHADGLLIQLMKIENHQIICAVVSKLAVEK